MRMSAESFIKMGGFLEAKSYTAGTNDGAAFDVGGFGQVLAIVNCGVSAATGDVTISLLHSDTSGGTYAIANKADGTTALTGVVVTNTTGDQATYVIACRTDLLKRFVKVRAVTADAASILSADIVAYDPKYSSDQAQGSANFAALGD